MRPPILYTLLFFVSISSLRAQPGRYKWHLDLPIASSQGKVIQHLFYTADSNVLCDLNVSCYWLKSNGDSLLVFLSRHQHLSMTAGAHLLPITFSSQTDSSKFHPELKDILLKTNMLPTGTYHFYLSATINGVKDRAFFLKKVDSSLSIQSEAKQSLNDIYAPQKKIKVLGIDLGKTHTGTALSKNASLADKTFKRADKTLRSKGLNTVSRQQAGKTFIDVYYKDWFVGYYELKLAGDLTKTVERERKQLTDDVTSLVKDGVEDVQTIFTKVKELNKENNKREVTGNVAIAGHMSNGQEVYAEQDNNYYELRGDIAAPIMDIPVSIEGYYTSQDRHRRAKASYVRIHYDTDKAKEELLKLISGYKDKYAQTVGKGKGLEGVYQSYLNKLDAEKNNMLADLKKETGVNDLSSLASDTAALRQQLTDSITHKLSDTLAAAKSDSTKTGGKTMAKATQIKDSVDKVYQQAMEKYAKLQAIEKNIEKYRTLTEEYKRTNYYDSVLAYDKIKGIENGDEQSYRQLAKTAGSLLPDGKFKKFVTGITNIDAGIISKEVSSYTLSGQTIKGIDVGYDLGFCKTAFTYGRVEYVGRDGTVDKYTGYSGRVMFKPGKKQNASIIYYGYMPSKKMLSEDEFFQKADVAMPAFRDPVHIVSATYEGNVSRSVHIASEAATSFRNTSEYKASNIPLNDKLAYKIIADGDIPGSNINLEGSYEHSGKHFENNSLPVSMSGTDRYRVAAKGVFFKRFLSLGVEYNYLQQQSFASKGGNSKWGFEIKTSSKRYPSVSIAYKPFTTFRSYTDTLNIPQRPLVGEVWTGKISYQLKRKEYTLRITGVYNKSSSQMDTNATNNDVLQLNTIYTRGKVNLLLNMGSTSMNGNNLPDAHTNTKFAGVSIAYALNRQWNISAGQDIGVARFGLSRYGANAGCMYRMKKTPLSVRASCRYTTYKLVPNEVWKQLVSGALEIAWQFKFKLEDKRK